MIIGGLVGSESVTTLAPLPPRTLIISSFERTKSSKFSIEIKRYENIDEILRMIEQTQSVRFKIKDRTINVYK